ncbi:DsrE family protein [Aggregatimonas sangjinii]|uniref:DsrE family protein n=1 Tax=Aggregatimonas sangjinii TaxID=2583587 RepID=A0A5B7SMZ0_9FLAO|nr:DsrE family protein [Aggregatimonas sangjinii]QCX00025.1 DsrE family protein [Aggregatimonas sangjinii]
MKKIISLLVFCSILFSIDTHAQTKESGPIIKEYGKVWKIENPDYKVDVNKEYKVVFDIMNSPDSHTEINKSIETAARFMNMHAQSGVPASNLKVVLVVHNQASKDMITDAAYQDRYQADNPNKGLIQALMDAGAKVIFCGQSSLSRNFPREELLDGVQLSLSAMTALIQLQDEGYQLIKF